MLIFAIGIALIHAQGLIMGAQHAVDTATQPAAIAPSTTPTTIPATAGPPAPTTKGAKTRTGLMGVASRSTARTGSMFAANTRTEAAAEGPVKGIAPPDTTAIPQNSGEAPAIGPSVPHVEHTALADDRVARLESDLRLTWAAILGTLALLLLVVMWLMTLMLRIARPASAAPALNPAARAVEDRHGHQPELLRADERESGQSPVVASGEERADDRVPRVRISRGVLRRYAEYIRKSPHVHAGREDGAALIGAFNENARGQMVTVRGWIEAGPGAQHSHGQLVMDRRFQQKRLETLQLLDASADHVGDAHQHPGGFDSCSGQDEQTDLASIHERQNTPGRLSLISTMGTSHRMGHGNHFVEVDGLRIAAYWISGGTRRHQRVAPEIVDEPLLEVPPALEALLRADHARYRLELAAMRGLPEFVVEVAEWNSDGNARPCIRMTHRRLGYRIAIVPATDESTAPEAYVTDAGGNTKAIAGDFLEGPAARHVWAPEIALRVQQALDRESSGRASAA